MALQVVKTSKKFSLTAPDWLKGLLVSVGSSIVSGLIVGLNSGHVNAGTLKTAGITGLSAGLTYIAKNFATNDVAAAQKTIDEAIQKERDRVAAQKELPLRQ